LLEQNIKPILCIGETDQERKENLTKKVLRNQLKSGLKDIININKILIAYEPVWAISTFQKGNQKQSAEINDINEAHLYIKTVLTDLYGNKADKIKVLYGGTVKPQNSQEILSLNQVDGALVGSASLKISSFNAILKSI
jgi:triosephosphate isomerase